MKMIDIEKLVALMTIQYIGSTQYNQFILTDKEGKKLNLEKYDYPNGDYAIFDMTNNEEMVRVKFPRNIPGESLQVVTNTLDTISAFMLESGLTYEISLEYNDNFELCSGKIINGDYAGHEIKVDDATASFYSVEYAAERAPRPEGFVMPTFNSIPGIQQAD